MKPTPIDPTLLDKYLQGTCNEADRALVEAWYVELERGQNFHDPILGTEKEELLKAAFQKISDHLDQEEENSTLSHIPWRWVTGIAASLLLLCGFLYVQNKQVVLLGESSVVVNTQAGSKAPIEFINQEPRIVQHTLPDGSTVWMRPAARITYPQTFAEKNRTIMFTGEGFFDIQKDRSRPFFIHSGEMTVRVLGTSFNVKAASDQKLFEIDVVTGSVEVTAPDRKANNQRLILEPNQQALFETETKRLFAKVRQELLKNEIYQSSTFHFQDTPVREVIRQLESRFDIKIYLSDPAIALCRLNADFDNQSFPAIVEMLCRSLESTYTIQDNTITIAGDPCD
jgi:ferric-dicitrate binding protein FerR (iron transport regulator)